MNLIKKEHENFRTFASIVINQCEGFKQAELSLDNFKCLIFVHGLASSQDTEISGVLNKHENEPNLTLQNLAKDCQRFINVCQDAKDIKVSGISHIKKVCQENKVKKKDITSNPCGELHFYNDSPYKNKERFCSIKKEHKKTHCMTKVEKRVNNYIKVTNVDESADQNIRKFVQVKILNKNIKLKLDSGSYLSIINVYTREKIGKPMLMVIKKITRSVTG